MNRFWLYHFIIQFGSSTILWIITTFIYLVIFVRIMYYHILVYDFKLEKKSSIGFDEPGLEFLGRETPFGFFERV